MHGRLKVRTSEEEKIRKEKERAKKVIVFKSGMGLLFKKRSNKEYDEEALEISGQLVSANPDIYTVWNYRREIIFFLISEGDEEKSSKLLDSELQLTEHCLKVNPKSYCSWQQRVWVLDTRPDPDWTKELKLCNAYLKLDERNFHCWDYRRYVVVRSKIPEGKEFEYSTEKIHENFSNYSAWHYRSKLLTNLYPDKDEVRPIEEIRLRDELELVLNAAFTDPNDTSAWFYQRWLLGGGIKLKNLAVCRVTTTKSFIAFNQSVPSPSLTSAIEITVDDIIVKGVWKSVSGLKQDVLWILEHENDNISKLFSKPQISIKVQHENGVGVVCTRSSGTIDEDQYIGICPIDFKNNYGDQVIEELKKQQDSCQQLLELEPDSKWTHLTLAIIKHSIDHIENYDSCNEILKKLIDLDSKRTNYYKDLSARWHLEYFLQTNVCQNDKINKGKFAEEDEKSKAVELSTLYHLQYWSACAEIDLSGHKLTSQSLSIMYVLQNCQILNLNNNCFDSLRGFPALPKLHTLYLKGNKIDPEHIRIVKEKCPKIVKIVIE